MRGPRLRRGYLVRGADSEDGGFAALCGRCRVGEPTHAIDATRNVGFVLASRQFCVTGAPSAGKRLARNTLLLGRYAALRRTA